MDTDSLRGRLALVTGGSRGIGAAIAHTLAARGAKVVVTGRSAAELAEVAAAIDGVAVVADLADRAGTDQMIATVRGLGRVDVLVNNAGIAESAPLADTDDAMWDRIMELNATAPFRLTRAFVPAMVAAGWGRVVTIASNAGLTGYGYTAAYCAAKHAAVGLTRVLASGPRARRRDRRHRRRQPRRRRRHQRRARRRAPGRARRPGPPAAPLGRAGPRRAAR